MKVHSAKNILAFSALLISSIFAASTREVFGAVSSYSLWPSTAVPATAKVYDPKGIEVGVRFRSDVAGSVTALRFYKGLGNNSSHTGHLWSSSGQLLASVNFTHESASGWQQANLSSPVLLQPNATYYASYFSTSGYAFNDYYFASKGVDNGPLHAPQDGVSGNKNGLYVYSASTAFPVNSYHSGNYWVDVVFAPTASGSVQGYLDSADNGSFIGWAADTSDGNLPTTVSFYRDGPYNSGTLIGTAVTSYLRPDVNSALGIIGNHGFTFILPAQFLDGQNHQVYAYAQAGSNLIPLGASPQTTIFPNPKIPLDDFEGINVLAPWTFYNGAEFPGMTGSLTLAAGRQGQGAHLAYSNSGTGHYVSASRRLATPVTVAGLEFWARHPAGTHINIRLIDSTGQTLQYSTYRLLGQTNDGDWYRLSVPLGNSALYWGGANDGVVHQPVTEIGIIVEPTNNLFLQQGVLDFDDVAVWTVPPAAAPIDPASTSGTAIPNTGLLSNLGANIHFTTDDTALNVIQSAGFKWVRMDLVWDGVEKQPGVYDFSAYDSLLSATNSRGLKLHLILDYGNPLYTGSATAPPTTASAVTAFAKYAGAAAAHFKGQGVQYEIWNEQNGPSWTPTSAPAYATTAAAVIAAIRQNDPSALVTTGGISGSDPAYAQTMLSQNLPHPDAVSFHPYRNVPENLSDDVLLFRRLLQTAYPTNTPALWNSEWGFSSTQYGNGKTLAAQQEQAQYAVRQTLSAWSAGLPFNIYYDIQDDGTDGANLEHNFGLLATDYSDKPAMTALRKLFAIARAHPLRTVLPTSLTPLHALRFQNASETILALWTDDLAMQPLTVSFTSNPNGMTDLYGQNMMSAPNNTVSVHTSPVFVRFPLGVPMPNQAPSVSACSAAAAPCPSQISTLPNPLTLYGTVSDDDLPYGTLDTTWTVVNAPSGGSVIFSSTYTPATNARFSAAGDYVLRLTAGDGALKTFGDVTVTATPGVPEFAIKTLSGDWIYSNYTPIDPTHFRVDDGHVTAEVVKLPNNRWRLNILNAKEAILQVHFPWQSQRKCLGHATCPSNYDPSSDIFYYPYIFGIVEKTSSEDSGWSRFSSPYPAQAFAPLTVMGNAQSAYIVAATNWPPKAVMPRYGEQKIVMTYDQPVAQGHSSSYEALIAEVQADTVQNITPWQAALDAYRTWLDAQMSPVIYPTWMLKGEGTFTLNLQNYAQPFAANQTPDLTQIWSRIQEDYPWMQLWGQMSPYLGNCCNLNQSIDPHLQPALGSVIQNAVQQGRHVGYYSAPYFGTPMRMLDTTTGASWLRQWIMANQNNGANAFYVDTLGRGYWGEPAQVLPLFTDGTIPADTLIEGAADIYPRPGLISGALVGTNELCGAPGKTPENSVLTTFPQFGRYLLRDRLLYLGFSNFDWRFWSTDHSWDSCPNSSFCPNQFDQQLNLTCQYASHCAANGTCDNWTERQAFLLGAKLEAGESLDPVLHPNPVLESILQERKRVNWWQRNPVYWDTVGLDLSAIPASSQVEVRRFSEASGANLFTISNPKRASGLTFLYGGKSFSVPNEIVSILLDPPMQVAASHPDLAGFFENTIPRLGGWAVDKMHQSTALMISFYMDGPAGQGKFLTSVWADKPRSDLNAPPPGPGFQGDHGFTASRPAALDDGVTHQIYAYAIMPGNILAQIGSPLTSPSSNSAAFQGWLETVTGATIEGWAADFNHQAESTTVRIYIDGPAGTGRLIGSVKADRARGDLIAAGYSGNHGYRFFIPSAEQDGNTHSFYAYAVDSANQLTLLSSSPRSGKLACSTDHCPQLPIASTSGNLKLDPVGPAEMVFRYAVDRCNDNDMPDNPARAYRDAKGKVRVISSMYSPTSFVGPDLGSVQRQCAPILQSANDTQFNKYQYHEWLFSAYTPNGSDVYGLVHNEWYGQLVDPLTGPWPNGWVNSITLATSNDGGAHFTHPNPYVIRPAEPWQTGNPAFDNGGAYGSREPSNIIKKGNYYYAVFLSAADPLGKSRNGTCVMRTTDLSQASGWEVWTGTAWGNSLTTPNCQPLDNNNVEVMHESLVYSTYLNAYVLWGARHYQGLRYSYSFSQDLLNWTPAVDFLPGSVPQGNLTYISALDPADSSRNFENVGQDFYLYFTLNNGNQVPRDLIRQKVRFTLTSSDLQAPSIPAGVRVSSRTASTISWAWNASTDNVGITGYRLEVSTLSTFVFLSTGYPMNVGSVLSSTSTALIPNRTYYFRLRAYDAAGNFSSTSTAVSTTTLTDTLPPAAPTALAFSPVAVSSMVLSWQAAVDNVAVTGYRLDVSVNPGFTSFLSVYNNRTLGVVTSTWVVGLSPNTTYYARLRAMDAVSYISTHSLVAKGITLQDIVSPAISSAAVTAVNTSSVTIQWITNEPSDTQVEYGTTTAYGTLTYLSPSPILIHTQPLTFLKPGTLYHYRVRSKDPSGNLAVSGDNTFITLGSPLFPAPQTSQEPSYDATFTLRESYVYPNPARHEATFRIKTGLADQVELRIYNAIGEKVQEANMTETIIVDGQYAYECKLTGLASGVYVYVAVAKKEGHSLKAKGKFAIIK